MTLLKYLSVFWSFAHVLVLLILLFEFRYSTKKTAALTVAFMLPLTVLNLALFFVVGTEMMIRLLVATCVLPCLLFFFILSKHRDGRVLFTFCGVGSVCYEIMMISNLMDYYLFGNTYIATLVIRLVAFPLLEIAVYKKLRPTFLVVQRGVRGGWYIFSAVSALFYAMLLLMSGYPTPMTSRPNDLPVIIIALVLMPLMYLNIFQLLYRQQKLYELSEKDNILRLQVANMQQRVEQLAEADEKFRIERHDMRHRLSVIAEMVSNGNYDEVREYISKSEKKLKETGMMRWCANPVLDAVLTSYFRKAEEKGIEIRANIAIPAASSIDAVELSTVFANAIENAIIACEKLPKEERYIEVKVLSHPQFMMMISNPYTGNVKKNEKGVPISKRTGHGFGTRSITAFCEKHGAFYEYKMDNNVFMLSIVMSESDGK